MPHHNEKSARCQRTLHGRECVLHQHNDKYLIPTQMKWVLGPSHICAHTRTHLRIRVPCRREREREKKTYLGRRASLCPSCTASPYAASASCTVRGNHIEESVHNACTSVATMSVSLFRIHRTHLSIHTDRAAGRRICLFVGHGECAPDEHWSARERISPPFPDTVTQIQCRVSSVSKFSVPLSPHSTSSLSLECSPTERIRHHTHRERERETERTHESTYSILTSVSSSSAVTSSIHNHPLLSLFTPTPPHSPTPIIHTHTLIHRHCESTHHPSCRVGLASVESISSISYPIDGF